MVGPVEHRRFRRTLIALPVEFAPKGSSERRRGLARDVSLGGMYVETSFPVALGLAVLVSVSVPGQRNPVLVSATVRWADERGMGVQFGLLGARETHAISRVARAGIA
jgi:type IV pilus assembly protein PilZ